MANQDVVEPLVEIAISGQTYIVKDWTTAQDGRHGLKDDKVDFSLC